MKSDVGVPIDQQLKDIGSRHRTEGFWGDHPSPSFSFSFLPPVLEEEALGVGFPILAICSWSKFRLVRFGLVSAWISRFEIAIGLASGENKQIRARNWVLF